jgi:hypothetical protein
VVSLVLLNTAVGLGCSGNRIIVLSEQPNLVAGGSSKWRRLTGDAIPLDYEIRRVDYVVALRAFENGSAGLDVQPKSLLGANLELRSDQQFMDAVHLELAPDAWPDGRRYWVLPNWVKGQPFRFSVVDTTGHVLGTEELPYTEVRVVAWEGWSRHGT